jgi:hypothetical protein
MNNHGNIKHDGEKVKMRNYAGLDLAIILLSTINYNIAQPHSKSSLTHDDTPSPSEGRQHYKI